MYRVLFADDSVFMRRRITAMIESQPNMKIVGEAKNGQEAVELARTCNPDVILLDVNMPIMTGLQALKEIMASNPKPVIMLSSDVQEGAPAAIEAYEIGALSCIQKPGGQSIASIKEIEQFIVNEIQKVAKMPVNLTKAEGSESPQVVTQKIRTNEAATSLVAIGVSTGGPKALMEIIPHLKHYKHTAIFIVQHMPSGFVHGLRDRLNQFCPMDVTLAKNRERILGGHIYVADAGKHLVVKDYNGDLCVRLSGIPTGLTHIPSVDVMLTSVAEHYGAASLGVILTGMGVDGVEGCKKVKEAGGTVFAESEATATVYGMPARVIEKGYADKALPISQMHRNIDRWITNHENRSHSEVPIDQ